MKSKISSGLFLLALGLPMLSQAQASGDWRSALASAAPTATPSSGDYNTAANWQKFDATAMAWVAAANKPGTSNSGVLTVLNGSAITINASSGSLNLVVQPTGSIKFTTGGTSAQGGLRFSGTSLQNDGLIGGAPLDDSINIEMSGIIPHRATISGAGTTIVNRLRILGGSGTTSATNNINGIINMPITFTNQSSSFGSAVGLTAYYGSSSLATDFDTITINAGVTVKFVNAAVLHYQSQTNVNPMGSYVYNINGIADLSASSGTSYFSPAATNASSLLTLNVSGILKLSAVFSTIDSSLYNGTPATPTPGAVMLNVLAGGVVDATPTDFKMDKTYGPSFNMAPTAIMKRFISSSNFAVYPISTSNLGNNTLSIQNIGTADTFSVGIDAFNVSSVTTDMTQVVNREWHIQEVGTGGKIDSLKFTWLAAEQGSAVTTTPSVYVRPASGGTTVEYTTAAVSGTGTATSPYIAILGVTGGMPAGTYYIGKPGLPTAVANVANGGLNVTVAPNPAANKQISFQISGNKAGTYKVAVTNMAGQVVYRNEVNYNANTTNYKVNMSNMPAGVYQLQISNGQTNIGNRVVVE